MWSSLHVLINKDRVAIRVHGDELAGPVVFSSAPCNN